ncbi:hypothetical protein GS432_14650 [Rhodococcus hoagii]|nr:hypothetical protein [Prescottella equi]
MTAAAISRARAVAVVLAGLLLALTACSSGGDATSGDLCAPPASRVPPHYPAT